MIGLKEYISCILIAIVFASCTAYDLYSSKQKTVELAKMGLEQTWRGIRRIEK